MADAKERLRVKRRWSATLLEHTASSEPDDTRQNAALLLAIVLVAEDADIAFERMMREPSRIVREGLREALVEQAVNRAGLDAAQITKWHTHILDADRSAEDKTEDIRAVLRLADFVPGLSRTLATTLPLDVCYPLLRWDESSWPHIDAVRRLVYKRCLDGALLDPPLAEATFDAPESQALLFGATPIDLERVSVGTRSLDDDTLHAVLSAQAMVYPGLVEELVNGLALPVSYLLAYVPEARLRTVIAQFLQKLPPKPPPRRTRMRLATVLALLLELSDAEGPRALLDDPRLSSRERFHVGRCCLRFKTGHRRFAKVPREAIRWVLRSTCCDDALISWAATADIELRYYAASAQLRSCTHLPLEVENSCLRSTNIWLRVMGLQSRAEHDALAAERLLHIAAHAPDPTTRSVAIHSIARTSNATPDMHQIFLNELMRPLPRTPDGHEDCPARLDAARALCRTPGYPFEATVDALFSAGLARHHYYIGNALRTWFDPSCTPDGSPPVGSFAPTAFRAV